jgi:hypothetical protein
MKVKTMKTMAVIGIVGSALGLSSSIGVWATESAYLAEHPSSELAPVLQQAMFGVGLVATAVLLACIGLFGIASYLERLERAEQWIAGAAPIVAGVATSAPSSGHT